MSPFLQACEQYALDALKAAPAAFARILLGWKAEPAIRRFTATFDKAIAILGSVAMGVMFGEIARNFPQTAPHAGLIVVVVAFNAQHIANRSIALSNPIIRRFEKEARDRLKKRTHSDEDDE